MPVGPVFIVQYDYRSDDGPSHVGPFRSRRAANEWADRQRIHEASWGIVKLWVPPDAK